MVTLEEKRRSFLTSIHGTYAGLSSSVISFSTFGCCISSRVMMPGPALNSQLHDPS